MFEAAPKARGGTRLGSLGERWGRRLIVHSSPSVCQLGDRPGEEQPHWLCTEGTVTVQAERGQAWWEC